MANFFSQSYFIPSPTITEHNCPDQKGRVYIVTGGYSGVGLELTKLLVQLNATVYIAGRSTTKANTAIAQLKHDFPSTSGRAEFLPLDLSDLSTLKPAVTKFLSQESRLDVLVNNAGVMFPPLGSKTTQHHDLQTGTNCLGPYLLYTLLLPLLSRTAASSPEGSSVRVCWAGSLAAEAISPKPGGMKLDDATGRPLTEGMANDVSYGQSKVGNLFLARVLAGRHTGAEGVVHVAFNPGNLRTGLQRHWKGVGAAVAGLVLLNPAHKGGYTELWACVAPEITKEKSGAYVWPWGRFGRIREDVEMGMKAEAEGGTGLAERFVGWCERETKAFL